MDIAKTIFESIDKMLNKSQNESIEIDGSDRVIVENDICYNTYNKKDCLLDCYYKKGCRKKFPVIFYIHGGGFMAGGKEYRKALSTWYATHGFFVVNVNYGLSPDYVFPRPIKHLINAIHWVENNAENYNLDLDKVVVAGDSAGAYFAAMLAAITSEESLQKRFSVETKLYFKAAILNCGLYDMESVIKKHLILRLNKKVFEAYTGIKADDVKKYRYKNLCSPLSLVSKNFPATFLIYAEKDIFCGGQAELFIDKLKEEDIYFESYHSTSLLSNHCFCLEWKSVPATQANELQIKFLNKIKNGRLPKHLSETSIRINKSEK